MLEELLPELPKGLPVRRDRTSIYLLYDEFNRLNKEFGWTKNLLFTQTVSLRNRRTESIPIYCYSTANTGPATWLVATLHGRKEQAATMAVASQIDYIARLGQETPMVVIGFLNANYIKDQRFPDKVPGWKRTSLCDFDHLVPRSPKKLLPRSKTPSNPYAEILGREFLQLLKTFPAQMLIDLHEDFPWPHEVNGYGKAHIYSDGILGWDDPVAKACVATLKENDIDLRENTHNGYVEKTKGGISTMYNGSLENLFASDTLIINGTAQSGPRTPVCVTIETPTQHQGVDISMAKRIQAQAAIIKSLPELLKIKLANENLYQEAFQKKLYLGEFSA